MRKTLFAVLALLFVLSLGAYAQDPLIFNGDFQFDDPAAGWNLGGGAAIHQPGDMGVTPLTDKWAGIITSWSGNWSAASGTLNTTVYGLAAGNYNLSFDYYLGAHHSDASRAAGLVVKVNGAEVFNQFKASDSAWNYNWQKAVVPVVIAGDSADVTFEYHAHFAEWTWAGTDNITLTQAVPEPGSILALVSGLAGFGGMIIRRRK